MKMSFKSLFFGSATSGSIAYESIYTLFRFYCGISIAVGAGLSKVFHKLDEAGDDSWGNLVLGVPNWFVTQVSDIGFTFISPTFWAYLAVYGELIGGLFVAVGLFTRISAFQLAFQFFIVSFIWYDEPVPFAMYYQQLIFWGFVLIAVAGGGRFSVDNWLASRKTFRNSFKKVAPTAALLCFVWVGSAQSTAAPTQVSFTVSNPAIKKQSIDIRYFDASNMECSGYGYDLGPFGNHAVHMPVGTRVYRKKNGALELAFVITLQDDGRQFNLNNHYEISREQWLQAANDEQSEITLRLKKAVAIEDLKAEPGAENSNLVAFRVAGKTPWKKEIFVRAQLPNHIEKTNVGFCQKLSYLTSYQVRYPVGTKLFQCAGPYWERDVKETYLFTVEAEKSNYQIRL